MISFFQRNTIPQRGAMQSPHRVLLASILLLPAALLAQETRASLSGTITDATGAVVVSATVRLTNVDTSVAFTTTSNETGQYRFLFLNPGKYKLTAELPGFKTFERDNIEVSVSQSGTLPIVLE